MQDLTFSVAELIGRPGEYRDLDIAASLEGVATALARLRPDVEGRLRAESVFEGVLVTGRVGGSGEMSCARCLVELDRPVEVEVTELYYGPGHVPEDDPEAYAVVDGEVRLEGLLRDSLVLALPLNPLCRPDCKGLCSVCGTDLNAGTCTCTTEETDPRWAPLEALRERLES